MKTSFSEKVTGSITVSIEPSNEDGDGGDATADECGSILVDVLLKSLVNDAVKKYAGNKEPTVEEEEDDDDLSSPLPQRRIPSNADDSVDDSVDESVDDGGEDDDGNNDEVGELPNVEIDNEYEEDYQLSQKMDMMSLRRRY